MKELIQYQIEVAICMAAFALLYLILWRKETNFTFRRFLLLGIPLFSILIPLINYKIDLGPVPETATIQYVTYIPNQLELVYAPIISEAETMSGWDIAFWVFSFGAIIMLFRLVISYARIMEIYRRSELHASGTFRMINDPVQSFSFFNMIMINRSQASSTQLDYILAHEKAHKIQGHSWDILWLEIIKMLHWFNPVIWMITQESKKNLEYLADRAVTGKTGNAQKYQYAIVEHASQSGYQLLKTQFSNTNLKNRIIMMNQPKNHKIASWKLFAIMPLLAILFMSFSLKIENLDIKKEIIEVLPEFKSINKLETTILTDESDEKIYEISEVGPMPDGERMKYFYENLYEHIEKTTGVKKSDIQGRAIVHFIVMKDGSLKDIRIIDGLKPEIDQEILRFVNEGPVWTPGLEFGEPVNVRRVLTIPFGKETNPISSPRRLIGKLLNEQNFTAIVGARVKIKGTDIETITDEAGIFSLDLKPAHKELIISGNQIKPTSFEIHPQQTSFNYLLRLDDAEVSMVHSDSTITEIFTVVEDPPYPSTGDMASYFEEIHKSLNYPKEAKEKGVEGRVFVQFIVKSDGSLTDVKAVKGIGYGCDEEAIRVIKEGPSWVPGMQRGKKVNVRLIIPVAFGTKLPEPKRKIEGTVKDELGNTIGGCNVTIKWTTTGTITDNEGRFKLTIPEKNNTELVFASQGYQTQTITAKKASTLFVVLKKADPRSDQEFNEKLFNIRIRGMDKVTTPLYIVNGVEVENIKDLSPNDIESIEVLKDSFAKDKYGEKAADGVIFIKLKGGTEFKPISKINSFKDHPPLIIVDGVETQLTMAELEEKHPVESIDKISVLKDPSATEKYGEKGKNGVIIIETRPPGADRSKLDKMPDYPGGMEAFYKTIQKNIKYPSDARKENIQGKVLVSFTIASDGAVKDIKAEKSEYVLLEEIVVVGYSNAEINNEQRSENQELSILEEEVIRNIKLMDNFKPGTKNADPVEVRMTLPVTFKLQ